MFNYRNLLIQSDKTIFDAIKIIDSTDYRSCFVVNKSYKLLGSITDGDIRKYLINDSSADVLLQPISICMNNDFIYFNGF